MHLLYCRYVVTQWLPTRVDVDLQKRKMMQANVTMADEKKERFTADGFHNMKSERVSLPGNDLLCLWFSQTVDASTCLSLKLP